MMRTVLLILLLLGATNSGLRGQDGGGLFGALGIGRDRENGPERPNLDPKQFVNDSKSFLKEREPEMNGEEYALYERVIDLLDTNVPLALKMLETMMDDKERPSPAFEFILGNAYYAGSQFEKAEHYYRSAVTRLPTFLRGWNNLGILYYTNGRYAEAVECFSKSVALGDRTPSTFGLLGYCLERKGDLVSAEMSYMQALSGDPGNSDWKEGLLRIYIEGRQYGRAESLLKNLIKERPKEQRLWLAYAGVLIAQGRKMDAIVVLEAADSTGFAGIDERLLLGDLYAEQNLPIEAAAAYEKVRMKAADRGEQKVVRLARVLTAAGKYAEAESILATVKGPLTSEGETAVLMAKAELAVARKQWAAARRTAEDVLKTSPLNGPALLVVARCYTEQQDVARAAIIYEEALGLPESAYRASVELAAIELRQRHYANCIAHLEKALSIQKSDTLEDYLARVRALAPAETPTGG